MSNLSKWFILGGATLGIGVLYFYLKGKQESSKQLPSQTLPSQTLPSQTMYDSISQSEREVRLPFARPPEIPEGKHNRSPWSGDLDYIEEPRKG